MPCEIIPSPNSPDARSTRAWNRAGSRLTAYRPMTGNARTTTIITKNQMNNCCDDDRCGSGHFGGWIAPERWRKPSRWLHDGGIGRRRPPRRYTTGSSTMPLNVLYGPAVASCTTYASNPMPRPRAYRFLNSAPSPAVAAERAEPDRDDQVEPEQQRDRADETAEERVAEGERRVAREPASPGERESEPEETERHAADPGERGEAERRAR